MKTKFIVLEASYRYNDEILAKINDDGGTPQLVFDDKEKATTYCEQLENKRWLDIFKGQWSEIPSQADFGHNEAYCELIDNQWVDIEVENQMFWVINFIIGIKYTTFKAIEETAKIAGFAINSQINMQSILLSKQIFIDKVGSIPKFYYIQEAEIIED